MAAETRDRTPTGCIKYDIDLVIKNQGNFNRSRVQLHKRTTFQYFVATGKINS